MLNLISELHQGNYQQQQIETCKPEDSKPKQIDNPKFKEEALRKLFMEQVKAKESRFGRWEQHLIAKCDRLNKDLETAHDAIKSFDAKLDNLQAGYGRGLQRR